MKNFNAFSATVNELGLHEQLMLKGGKSARKGGNSRGCCRKGHLHSPSTVFSCIVSRRWLQRCDCSDAVAAMRLQDSKSSRFATPGGAFSTELCCACAALVHAPLLPHFYRPLPAGCITDASMHKHRRVSSDASPSSSHFASCTQCVQTPGECARRSLTGRSLDDPIQLRYDIWLQQLEAEARGGHSKFAFLHSRAPWMDLVSFACIADGPMAPPA